ncbi:MAG TPA: hypothetical protein ENI17_18135 [Pseudomonas xinjiangensis]|uniref:DUF2489 domain-containing protein n=2 Tax=root TaxID=1 RepID=A0A7V1BPK6_9GAMM|nr:hypothetical protein [Halopseudomonas xinjiangensis]HEC49526.1 hypothetical protein [Halopseudomonas xinjiangensis]
MENIVVAISALLVPVIALLGALIAYLQWNTNHKRLKHELFERRYKFYEAIRDFLGTILTSGRVSQEAEMNYLINTSGIMFVFDKDIAEYIEKHIWHPAVDLRCLEAEIDGHPAGQARTANAVNQAKIKKELNKELTELETRFAKYLQLGH